MTHHYDHQRWSDQDGGGSGVYRGDDETDRITPADYHPAEDAGPSAYDVAVANYERTRKHHTGEHEQFMIGDMMPEITTLEGVNTPPWRGIDTFLRRGTMAAAFIILWTMIVVGVLAGAAIVNAVNDLGETSTVDQTEIPPGVDLLPDDCTDNPDLPGC